MLRAGDLRERVSIQSEMITPDGGGGTIKTWTTDATVWARVEPLDTKGWRAVEETIAGQLEPQSHYRVTIRHRSGVTSAHRLAWGSTALSIQSASMTEDRAAIVMMCTAGGPT
jgi:SPP1 family predicted phage head-tail adaptor